MIDDQDALIILTDEDFDSDPEQRGWDQPLRDAVARWRPVKLDPAIVEAQYAAQIELRLAALEQELMRVKVGSSPQAQPWWVEMSGSGADNPLFEDAVRYGQAWRSSAE